MRVREPAYVRQHRCDIGIAHAKPVASGAENSSTDVVGIHGRLPYHPVHQPR
jgi:hypothetical protein